MRRLIDANELRKEFEWLESVVNGCSKAEVRDTIQRIDNAPTVDAVEVVHGRWIDEYPYVRCSECNAEWVNCRTDNEPSLFYYCPNCGAKMDGE